jgi:hypothetical protein
MNLETNEKMSKTTKITFRDGEEESIQSIAETQGACFTHGPSAGKATWRAMIHEIAHGRLVVSKPGQKAKAKRKKFRAWAKHPAHWFEPSDGCTSMPLADALVASGRTEDELVAGGLTVDGESLYGLTEWIK